MWQQLPLRARLCLPLGMMFVAALLLGGITLQVFATGQLAEENEPAARSARASPKRSTARCDRPPAPGKRSMPL
jgi:two-component system sensor histidine kinase UhpB